MFRNENYANVQSYYFLLYQNKTIWKVYFFFSFFFFWALSSLKQNSLCNTFEKAQKHLLTQAVLQVITQIPLSVRVWCCLDFNRIDVCDVLLPSSDATSFFYCLKNIHSSKIFLSPVFNKLNYNLVLLLGA